MSKCCVCESNVSKDSPILFLGENEENEYVVCQKCEKYFDELSNPQSSKDSYNQALSYIRSAKNNCKDEELVSFLDDYINQNKEAREQVNQIKEDKRREKEYQSQTYESNSTASVLKVLGIITIICGIIAGIILGEDVGIGLALTFCIGGFVSGMVLYGFGEVVALLQRLVNKK